MYDLYKAMYYHLFNAVTDAMDDMGRTNYGLAYQKLMAAQQYCEELYLDGGEYPEDQEEEKQRFPLAVPDPRSLGE